MKKQNLTEAIEEGILKGFWKPIIIIISAWIIILFIAAGIFVFENNIQCGKNGCPVTSVSPTYSCNYPYVFCEITAPKCHGLNCSYNFIVSRNLCGWKEAKAYLDYNKQIFNVSILNANVECR